MTSSVAENWAATLPKLKSWAITPFVVGFVASSRIRSNPHAAYRRLRQVDPFHASPVGMWVLSRHQDVTAALRSPLMGSDESKADMSALRLGPLQWFSRTSAEPPTGAFHELFDKLLLFRDPPDHTRVRSLVNKAFTPAAVSSLEGRVMEIGNQLLDAVATRRSMELLSDFAYPLPARVICALLGAPEEDHVLIARHAPALARRLDPSPMRSKAVIAAGDVAVSEITSYLQDLIASRRADPGEDVLSALIAAEAEGDRLSHDELIATLILLLMAGHETTANLLGNGVVALLRDRTSWERLRADSSLDRSAVEELLRYDGPIQMTERITLDDVEFSGEVVPKGRIVILCVAAANRDPLVFERPDELDLGRAVNPHVAFGAGAHFCVGAPLARLEARVGLRLLADRCPDLRLAGPVHWRPSFTIRGLTALNVAW